MRSLVTAALLAGVSSLVAASAFAADLDYPPPPPLYEHPVPPAYIPGPVPPIYVPRRVPPVVYREPPIVVAPRPVIYPRPYIYGEPRPIVRRPIVRRDIEPRPYVEDYDRSSRGYGFYEERGRGFDRERQVDRDGDRDRSEQARYGHYLSRDELDRRAEREHGYGRADDRFGRQRFERDDRYADEERGRDDR